MPIFKNLFVNNYKLDLFQQGPKWKLDIVEG